MGAHAFQEAPSPLGFDFLVSLLICSSVTEVTQQSKARNKDDFIVALSPVIADAMATAYKGAPADVQNKLRKVVLVWKERSILEAPIQAAVEARIEGTYPTPHENNRERAGSDASMLQI